MNQTKVYDCFSNARIPNTHAPLQIRASVVCDNDISARTGKLSIGQHVNIKLDNYPYNENGMLQGTVTNISEVPNKDTYAIDVELINGLTTSYHKTLSYKEQMKGKADIITKNVSVMDRIFFNFKKLVDRN